MRTLISSLSALAVVAAMAAAPTSASAAPTVDTGGSYVPVNATRVVSGGQLAHNVAQDVQITGRAGVPSSGVAAVAITISLSATASGALVAYSADEARPAIATTQFNAGQRLAATSIVAVGTSGQIALYENSAQPVGFSVDVSGYYTSVSDTALSGPPTPVKSYRPVAPIRSLANKVIPAHGSWRFAPASPIPGNAGAVAATFSEFGATSSGYLSAGAPRTLNIAPEGVVRWTGSQRAGAFAIVPVDIKGQMNLVNSSDSPITVDVDVVGYYSLGAPSVAGMLDNVPAARVLGPTSIPAGGTRTVALPGVGGVPVAGVRAAVLTIYGSSSVSGSLVAYGTSTPPGTANVQFTAGRQTSDVAVVSVYPGGKVSFHNNANGPVSIGVDITAWVLRDTITAPAIQTGRYVRNLAHNDPSGNAAVMSSEGASDAPDTFVLLDIGAQLNDTTGVQLSDTTINLTYAELVAALQSYVNAYAGAGGHGKIAIGTNNSAADWKHYTGSARGMDWATKVVNAISAPSGVTVVGADDIEPDFGTKRVTDAIAWKSAFLSHATATTRQLVFNGSADGCPVDFGQPNGGCSNGWTEQQLYDLASGQFTLALPQIYNSRMAIQWTNIDQTGLRSEGRHLPYGGALTEHSVDQTYPADQGWAALYHGISTLTSTPGIPLAVDLSANP